MGWKEIHNSEPRCKEDYFYGVCPIYEEEATVTVRFAGSLLSKTDLHKTYHKAGTRCSLLEANGKKSSYLCMDKCTIVPEKYL